MACESASILSPYIQTHSHVCILFFLYCVCCVLMGGLNSSRWLFLTANRICPQGQIATWSEVGGKLQRTL